MSHGSTPIRVTSPIDLKIHALKVLMLEGNDAPPLNSAPNRAAVCILYLTVIFFKRKFFDILQGFSD
jgi:hypothetical protein